MTKEDNENFNNSTKCRICDNDFVDNDVKVKNHCHITGKYKCSAQRDCNFNVKLNHISLVVFHDLENDSYFIMQKLGKFNLKIDVIPNELLKYIIFTLNNKLGFIDSFQFVRSSVDSLVKNLSKDDCKYLSI